MSRSVRRGSGSQGWVLVVGWILGPMTCLCISIQESESAMELVMPGMWQIRHGNYDGLLRRTRREPDTVAYPERVLRVLEHPP